MDTEKPLTGKVTEYQGKNKMMYRIHLPEEIGLRGGDVVKFEIINDKEVKIIKLT